MIPDFCNSSNNEESSCGWASILHYICRKSSDIAFQYLVMEDNGAFVGSQTIVGIAGFNNLEQDKSREGWLK